MWKNLSKDEFVAIFRSWPTDRGRPAQRSVKDFSADRLLASRAALPWKLATAWLLRRWDRGAKLLSRERTSFVAVLKTKNGRFLPQGAPDMTSPHQGHNFRSTSWPFALLVLFGRPDLQWKELSVGMFIVLVVPIVTENDLQTWMPSFLNFSAGPKG